MDLDFSSFPLFTEEYIASQTTIGKLVNQLEEVESILCRLLPRVLGRLVADYYKGSELLCPIRLRAIVDNVFSKVTTK